MHQGICIQASRLFDLFIQDEQMQMGKTCQEQYVGVDGESLGDIVNAGVVRWKGNNAHRLLLYEANLHVLRPK